MRKLFSLLAAVLFAGSMMAETVDFSAQGYENAQAIASYVGTNFSVAFDKGTNNNAPKYYTTGAAIRCYGGNTLTVTSESTMTQIVLTFSTGEGTNEITAEPGTFATDTWTGSANSVVLTIGGTTGHRRIATMTVLLDGEGGGEPIVVVYDTLNVAQAIDSANALADMATSKKFYIEGYAVNVADYYVEDGTPKNQTFYLVDDAAAPDSVLQAFRATPKKNNQAYPVLAGDKVRLFGQLQKYVKSGKTQLEIVTPTVEFLEEVEGDRTIEIPEPAALDTITVARALEIGGALASGAATDIQYVIKGYSTVIKTAYDAGYKNESFWIADEQGSTAATNADGAFLVYRGKPDTEKSVGIGALVYVTAKIQKYTDGVIESWSNCAVHVEEQGEEEQVQSITVDSALTIGKALADGGVTAGSYEITGYVSNVYTFFNPDFKNETVWITDDPNSTSADKANAFEIYRGKPNTEAEVGWGAKVKIVCKIKNYKGTIENDGSNITFEVLEPSTFVPDTVTIEDAIAMTANLADGQKLGAYSVVKGFVRTVTTPYDASKNIASFELADYATGNAALATAYQATILKADAEKVKAGSYAVVTGYLMKHGSATQIAQGAITAFEEAPTFDTIYATPTEAQAAGMALEDNKRTQNVYVVTGYVVSANSYDPEDDDFQTFLMADEKGGQAIFKALNAKVPGNGVKVGDQVTLTGNVFKYVEGADISIYIENGEVEIIPAEGIENIVLTEEIQKVIVDGVLYIIRDGKMFNAQGVQVR